MPYLGKPFNPITSWGFPTEGNFDVKNNSNQWKKHSTLQPPDKLKFGLTHPDFVISQVREKPVQGFGIKMSNITKNANKIPSKNGIYSWGKPSGPDSHFPNYPQTSQFHTQSPQILNRTGSTIQQQKIDGKVQ